MAADFGFNGQVLMQYQPAYGTPPTGEYMWLPVTSIDPGITNPRETIDLVGGGREGGKLVRGLITVAPSIGIPLDLECIGWWLRLLCGPPVTTADGIYFNHVFKTGAATLPSAEIEKGTIGLSDYRRLMDLRANTFSLPLNFGQPQQTATMGLIGRSHERDSVSVDTSPAMLDLDTFTPLSGGSGVARRDGDNLALVTSANITISNGLDPIRAANRGDGSISTAEPGLVDVTGSLGLRLADRILPADAEGDDPIDLVMGYTLPDSQGLTFRLARTFVEMTDYPITGRAGIQATYNLMIEKSSLTGTKCQITLRNKRASYA